MLELGDFLITKSEAYFHLSAQKKKVVDDLINSLEKLKVAVEEVKTDFTRSPSYEGQELTSNETVRRLFSALRV